VCPDVCLASIVHASAPRSVPLQKPACRVCACDVPGVQRWGGEQCNSSTWISTQYQEYSLMRDALNATGRPMYFSLCECVCASGLGCPGWR
jgi:hypothetical protein